MILICSRTGGVGEQEKVVLQRLQRMRISPRDNCGNLSVMLRADGFDMAAATCTF